MQAFIFVCIYLHEAPSLQDYDSSMHAITLCITICVIIKLRAGFITQWWRTQWVMGFLFMGKHTQKWCATAFFHTSQLGHLAFDKQGLPLKVWEPSSGHSLYMSLYKYLSAADLFCTHYWPNASTG